jgi:hypothetical protein
MKKTIPSVLFLFLAFFLSNPLNAQEGITTDRPDQTESSSAVGGGNFQLESGFLLGFEEGMRQIAVPSTLFRYGLVDRLEIRVVSQFEAWKIYGNSIQGISDLELGFKAELFSKEDSKHAVALLSHLVMPTGSKEITADRFGVVNKLCISHELTPRLELGYNLGYNYLEDNRGDLTYSFALGIGVSEKVGIYVEPYGDIVDLDEFVASFDAGFTYLVNDYFQLDFSFGTGLNHSMNYLAAGVSWKILKE